MGNIRLKSERKSSGSAIKTPEPYEISPARLGSVTLFDIKGEMTALSEALINNAYKQAIGQDTRKIIFNFNRNAYIDSAGIAIFIQVLAHAIKGGQLVGITGLSKHFTKIFNMLGITKFAKIHDNLETAVEALNAQCTQPSLEKEPMKCKATA